MKSYIVRILALLMIIFSILLAACEEKRVDDAILTAKVKTQMTADGRVSPTRVNVDTLNSDVTLKGEVPTQQEKDAAEQAARSVEGVRSVSNQIVVNPAVAGAGLPTGEEMKRQAEKAIGGVGQEVKKEASEALLLGAITARLAAAGYSNVKVGIEQGVATLRGEVASEKDRIAVEAIVEKIEGVKQINNQLTVRGRAATPTPTSTPRRQRITDPNINN
ncbi:MAG: BON domain-containing protein [Blastocatellales bacterium]